MTLSAMNIKDRPATTDDQRTWPYLSNRLSDQLPVWFKGDGYRITTLPMTSRNGATSRSHVGTFLIVFSHRSLDPLYIWFDAWVFGRQIEWLWLGFSVSANNTLDRPKSKTFFVHQ